MRKRTIKKNFWLNFEENKILKEKCAKANISEAEFFRQVILGYEIKEKPDEQFYEAIKSLRGISINLNQIARKANSLDLIDVPAYKKVVAKLNQFIIEIKEKYLVSELKK